MRHDTIKKKLFLLLLNATQDVCDAQEWDNKGHQSEIHAENGRKSFNDIIQSTYWNVLPLKEDDLLIFIDLFFRVGFYATCSQKTLKTLRAFRKQVFKAKVTQKTLTGRR